jgi:UDP-3-O-[3-hydroxymyristoyl] glucosamine N-acyltransferase
LAIKSRLYVLGTESWSRDIAKWISEGLILNCDYEFLGCVSSDSLNELWLRPGDAFVMGLLEPKQKIESAKTLLARGAQFLNFIHPTSIVAPRSHLGIGVTLGPRSLVSCDVFLSDFTTLQHEATMGHNSRSGSGCTLEEGVDLTGFVRVGEGVRIGDHSMVAPHVELGDFVRVESHSVVIRNVSNGLQIGGIPARTLRVAIP